MNHSILTYLLLAAALTATGIAADAQDAALNVGLCENGEIWLTHLIVQAK